MWAEQGIAFDTYMYVPEVHPISNMDYHERDDETHVFTPQLVGEARQLGCPKIVLDHVHVYIYICMYAPQCLSTRCIGGTSIGDALATGIQAPTGTCKLMNIAIRTSCIKYQMLQVSLI